MLSLEPPEEAEKIGRRLEVYPEEYDRLQASLQPNEVLIGVFSQGVRLIAPLLNNEAEFDHIYSRYSEGWYTSVYFYAVDKAKLP